MANTTKLILPLMASNQAQKYITFNEAMLWVDILTMCSVKDRDLTAPPGSPADGDTYIVASSPTGLWAGKDLNIASWINGAWKFFPPKAGWSTWVDDEAQTLYYTGSAWNVSILFSGFLKTNASNVVTLASDAVTITKTCNKVNVQTGVTDDLVTLNGGTEGAIAIIEQANTSNAIVVKHGTGNIRNTSGADVTLNAYGKVWMGRYDGFNWLQL